MDRAFNRPICNKVDDVTEAVSAERSRTGPRHFQRSRGLQLNRAGRTCVNTEERGGDESHWPPLQCCVGFRTSVVAQADGRADVLSHTLRRGIRCRHLAPTWPRMAEPRRAAVRLCLTWTLEREPLFFNFLRTLPGARQSSKYSGESGAMIKGGGNAYLYLPRV